MENVLKVDEKARVIYFTANGMNSDENPYYEHLYRVNVDGTGLKQITRGDFFHQPEVDDDARFVVDNYSRVNSIPCAVLLDNNGNRLMTIQESDFSQLMAANLTSGIFPPLAFLMVAILFMLTLNRVMVVSLRGHCFNTQK